LSTPLPAKRNSCRKKRSPFWSARCHSSNGPFQPAHGFFFGNAGIGHTIQVPLQGFFSSCGVVAIVRDALVEIVRNQL
jgi:hypothetical protein